jgi:phage-related protein
MMGNELNLLGILMTAIGGLVATLTIVIGWIGSRVHSRLDSIAKSLQSIERDLRGDLSNLDRRLVAIETRHELEGTGVHPVLKPYD